MSPAEALVFAVAADWAICWSLLYLHARPRQKPPILSAAPRHGVAAETISVPVQCGPTPAEQELLRQMVPPTAYRRSESGGYGDALGHRVWIDPKKYTSLNDYMVDKALAQAGLPVPPRDPSADRLRALEQATANGWADAEMARRELLDIWKASPVLAGRVERAS